MNRKKSSLLMLVVVLTLSVTTVGCVSVSPVLYSSNPGIDYTILGEVTFSTRAGSQSGLNDFLAVARRQFPGTDFVKDVVVDRRVTQFLIFRFGQYNFSGTAIRYNR